MVSVQSVIGCRLTFEKYYGPNCGAGCGLSYCGTGRAAGYDVVKFAVRADCGPS